MGFFEKTAAEQRASLGNWIVDAYKKDKVKRDKIKADKKIKKTFKVDTKVKVNKAPRAVNNDKGSSAPTSGGGSPREVGKNAKGKTFRPQYMKKTSAVAPIKMNTDVYKASTFTPTDTTKGPDMSRDAGIKNRGSVRRITEDTKYGGMQKKEVEAKTTTKKDKNKKKYRTKVTMQSMRVKY
jgi:hypothetical protein